MYQSVKFSCREGKDLSQVVWNSWSTFLCGWELIKDNATTGFFRATQSIGAMYVGFLYLWYIASTWFSKHDVSWTLLLFRLINAFSIQYYSASYVFALHHGLFNVLDFVATIRATLRQPQQYQSILSASLSFFILVGARSISLPNFEVRQACWKPTPRLKPEGLCTHEQKHNLREILTITELNVHETGVLLIYLYSGDIPVPMIPVHPW